MTVVFCLDDNPQYLMMLRVALRSLRAVFNASRGKEAAHASHDLRCVVVYAGQDEALVRAIQTEGAEVARYAPTLTPAIVPQNFHRCIGAFLKLELALVPELANERTLLYCDCDVMFMQPLDTLFAMQPAYMCMAREASAPFWHEYESMSYQWRGNTYVVPMPFPIWTFSSGVVLFNLDKLRRADHVHNFLAFCAQNIHRIGNLDQSLLNYFFGKRITRISGCWNRPPYHANALTDARIIHFHGPKPWETERQLWADLRINDYYSAREHWLSYLQSHEKEQVSTWTP